MLTATYVILSLSAEQKKERQFISRLLQYVQAIRRRPQEMDPAYIESQLKELTTFAESRHQRKLEACLMPAVRAADSNCGPLINDLETLSRHGGITLAAVYKCLRRAMRRSASQCKFLCRTIDLYCHNLLKRLDREEQELLPLAQKVISSAEWFEIGRELLAQEDSGAANQPSLRPRHAATYAGRPVHAGA
jgi:hemerythrin-like domain-containing protein